MPTSARSACDNRSDKRRGDEGIAPYNRPQEPRRDVGIAPYEILPVVAL